MIGLHIPPSPSTANTPTFSRNYGKSPVPDKSTLPRASDRIIAMEWIDMNGIENESIAKPKITDDILNIRYLGESCFSKITIRRMRWLLVNCNNSTFLSPNREYCS